LIQDWVPCDPSAIISDHGRVFDKDNNEIADLAHYPLHDPEGNRISIFDQYGTQIERWEVAINEDSEGGGILFDLDGASTLLHSVDEDEEPMEFRSYPQAFLPQYGHIQSTGVVPEIQEVVHQINQTLKEGLRPVDEDQDEAEFQAELEDPLKATFFQGYNHLQHRISRQAGGAETMQGDVSLALAGQYAETTREKRIAEEKKLAISPLFPFQHMEEKLKATNDVSPPTDVRLENYFTINFTSLPPERRTGR